MKSYCKTQRSSVPPGRGHQTNEPPGRHSCSLSVTHHPRRPAHCAQCRGPALHVDHLATSCFQAFDYKYTYSEPSETAALKVPLTLLCNTARGPRRLRILPHNPFHPASCAMNTVANRTREQDLPMASNLVRGTRPREPTFPVQRNGCETFRGCRGSEKDVFFDINKYSRNVH